MLYAILCYANEETVFSWTKEEEDAVMAKLYAVQAPLAERGKLGPVGRLMPTTAATTVRKGKEEPLVLDGPFDGVYSLADAVMTGFALWVSSLIIKSTQSDAEK